MSALWIFLAHKNCIGDLAYGSDRLFKKIILVLDFGTFYKEQKKFTLRMVVSCVCVQ